MKLFGSLVLLATLSCEGFLTGPFRAPLSTRILLSESSDAVATDAVSSPEAAAAPEPAAPKPAAPKPAAAPITKAAGGALSVNPINEVTDFASLQAYASKLNPAVNYFDPLQLGSREFWPIDNVLSDESLFTLKEQDGMTVNDRTIAWLRHAEIKHGRVSMAAFVGWCVQANGIHFPWDITLDGSNPTYAAGLSPPEQWDALPDLAKWQMAAVVGFLEFWGEGGGNSFATDKTKSPLTPHYTKKDGLPGQFPTFNLFSESIHPVPFNLYDPFGFSKNISVERAQRGLIAEVNNSRLAMIGIFGFVSESKIPGSVPFLSSLGIKPYAGEFMAPFESTGSAVAESVKPVIEAVSAAIPSVADVASSL